MESVSALGFDIPVWDYYTAGERESLESLIATQDETLKARYDLEALRVFIRTRCKKNISIEKLLDMPVKGDEVAEAVEVLCSPLFVILRERANRRERKRVEQLTNPQEIQATLKYHQGIVQALEEMLSVSGHEPAA